MFNHSVRLTDLERGQVINMLLDIVQHADVTGVKGRPRRMVDT